MHENTMFGLFGAACAEAFPQELLLLNSRSLTTAIAVPTQFDRDEEPCAGPQLDSTLRFFEAVHADRQFSNYFPKLWKPAALTQKSSRKFDEIDFPICITKENDTYPSPTRLSQARDLSSEDDWNLNRLNGGYRIWSVRCSL